ncbi:hypothetical protein C8Q80DRAFT_743955 [Daedaleopsis nitida]|nr:hypothetical protein C8Q80DRAFT_743955 [Daedaleopsis nitida]
MGALQSLLFEYDVDSETDNADPAQPVRLIRALLAELGLPAELVLDIMDLAEYYPAVRAERTDIVRMFSDHYKPRDHCSALLYLVSPPLPAGRNGEGWRMKSVTWTVEGHNQGWVGHYPGSFTGANSWYEACIFRPSHVSGRKGPDVDVDGTELDYLVTHSAWYRTSSDIQAKLGEVGWTLVPNCNANVGSSGDAPELVWRVQSNRGAEREFQRHVVEWGPETSATARRRPAAADAPGSVEDSEEYGMGDGDGAGFVDALRPGDRVGLWTRVMYGGWQNHTKSARVELVYDVR